MQKACEMVTSLLTATAPVQRCPYSNMNVHLLKLLQREGFIRGFVVEGNRINILLKRYQFAPVIRNIQVVSKPSRDIWLLPHELKERTGMNTGTWIMQTPEGFMTHRECIELGVGGKVIFAINNGSQKCQTPTKDTSMGNTNSDATPPSAATSSPENSTGAGDLWVVHIRQMNGVTLTYNVNPHTETVSDLMDRIHREAEIDPMLQRLIFRGQVISHEPHKHLDEFLTESGQTVHMVVRPVSTIRNANSSASSTASDAAQQQRPSGSTNDVPPPQIGNIFSNLLPPGLLGAGGGGAAQFVLPGEIGGSAGGAPGAAHVVMQSFQLDPMTGQILGGDQQGGPIPLPFGGLFGQRPAAAAARRTNGNTAAPAGQDGGASTQNPSPPAGDSSASAPRPRPAGTAGAGEDAPGTPQENPQPTAGQGVQDVISGLTQLFGSLASGGQVSGGGTVTTTFTTGNGPTSASRPRSFSARLPGRSAGGAAGTAEAPIRGRPIVSGRRPARQAAGAAGLTAAGSSEGVATDSNRIPVLQHPVVNRGRTVRDEELQHRAEQTPGFPWRTLIDSDTRVDHLMGHLSQLPGPRHYRGSDDLPTFLRNYQRLLLSAAQMVGDVSLMLQSDTSRGPDAEPNPQRQDDLAYLARMLAELTDTSEMMVSVVNRVWCDMFDPEGRGHVRTRDQEEDATQTEATSAAQPSVAPSAAPEGPTGATDAGAPSVQGGAPTLGSCSERGDDEAAPAGAEPSSGRGGRSGSERARPQHSTGPEQSPLIRFVGPEEASAGHQTDEIDAGEYVVEEAPDRAEPCTVPEGYVIPLPDTPASAQHVDEEAFTEHQGGGEVDPAVKARMDRWSSRPGFMPNMLSEARAQAATPFSNGYRDDVASTGAPPVEGMMADRWSASLARAGMESSVTGQPPEGLDLQHMNALLQSAVERLGHDANYQQLLDPSSDLSVRFPALHSLLEAVSAASEDDNASASPAHPEQSPSDGEPH